MEELSSKLENAQGGGLRSTAEIDRFWSRSMFIYSFRGLSYTGITNPLKFIIHTTSSLRSQIRLSSRVALALSLIYLIS